MPADDAASVLDHWNKDAGRTLTPEQRAALLDCFDKCPVPLYLQVGGLGALRTMADKDHSCTRLKLRAARMRRTKLCM